MLSRIFCTLLMCSAAGSFMLPANAQDWSSIKLGTEGAFPPFNFMGPDSSVQGFDIDFGNALCEELNISCEWVIQDWDGMIPALKAKKFDAIIAQMSITEERKKQIDFSEKYTNTPSAFIVRKDSDISDTSPEALAGKTLGAQSATIQANYLEDLYGDSTVKLYSTQDEANLDLASGRLDAVMADKPVLNDFIETDDGTCCAFTEQEYSDPKYFGDGVGIAIRKGNPNLKALLNRGIKALIKNGKYAEVNAKYFPFNVYGE